MKYNKYLSRFVVGIVCLLASLLGATTSFAQPNQEVLEAIAEQGTARIIVGLDVRWKAEGFLSDRAVVRQRTRIADAQTQFIETLNQDLANDAIIDDVATSNGTPVIPAEITFKTVPYLVMRVNSQTLLY